MKKKIELALHILSTVLLVIVTVLLAMERRYGSAVGAGILFVLNVFSVWLLVKHFHDE